MSDDAQRPGPPEDAAPDPWAPPGEDTTGTPGGRIPGTPVSLGKPADVPQPAPDPWAPPTGRAPGRSAGPEAGALVGPHGTVVPGGPAPSEHDQPTAVSLPGPAAPGAPAAQGPWTNPFAPPSPAPAPARAQYPPPYSAPGEPVPPPPIGPEGPGQVPYGYPELPAFPQYGTPYGPQGAVPGYGWPGMPLRQPRDGLGTASLVLGIISAVVFCLWPVAIIVGVLAVIFGIIGRRRANRGEATNGGMALAGLICGSVGTLLGVALLVLVLVMPDSGADPWAGTGDGYSTSLVTGPGVLGRVSSRDQSAGFAFVAGVGPVDLLA